MTRKSSSADKTLMAGTGWQDSDVASLEREDPALVAAEADAAFAARDAEHLVDSGMVVHVIVDAIAPGIAPSIGFEQILDHGRGIVAVDPDGQRSR